MFIHVHISFNLNFIVFYRMVLSTKRIHNSFRRNFPERAKQMPSKVICRQENATSVRSLRAKIVVFVNGNASVN